MTQLDAALPPLGGSAAASHAMGGRRRRRPLAAAVLVALPLAFIFVVFDLPLLITLMWSFADPKTGAFTFQNYADFATSSTYVRVMSRTFAISAAVAVATGLVGYPLAYWMTRLGPRGQALALAAVMMTFWVPILVRTYAWIVLFGNGGLVNRALLAAGLASRPVEFLYNEVGVAFGMMNVLLPYMVLPLYAAMRQVNGGLLIAAATLGARPAEIFRRVFLPLTLPAVGASMVLVFILSLGFYVTPAILGGGRLPLIANMMDLLVNRFARWEMAAVNAAVLLALTLVLFGIYQWLRERR